MAHSYQLDLATLLTLLTGQTGRLYTTGVLLPGIELPCEVMVTVATGRVQACSVVNQGRVVLLADDALQRVLPLWVLSWTYIPDVPHTSSPSAHDLAPFVPQRVREVPLHELKAWPRVPRRLYQLTDVPHSLDQLAHLLRQPLDVVMATAMQLQQQGVIRLASQQERQEGVRQQFPAWLSSLHTH